MDVVAAFFTSRAFDIGATALLSLVVVMILTGRLIPKATHDREMVAAVTRGDEWKAAAEKSDETNAIVTDQNTKLIDANKVVEAVLKASAPGPGGT